MMTSPFADAIVRIKNGFRANLEKVELIYSGLVLNVLKILKEEGFINGIEVINNEEKRKIIVLLRYYKKKSTIKELNVISKPSQHIYVKKEKIPVKHNGYGFVILTTNKGIMTGHRAKELQIGGKVLLEVF